MRTIDCKLKATPPEILFLFDLIEGNLICSNCGHIIAYGCETTRENHHNDTKNRYHIKLHSCNPTLFKPSDHIQTLIREHTTASKTDATDNSTLPPLFR